MRLSVYIAKSGICSRRAADELIQRGKVTVNSQTVIEPFYRVAQGDDVKVNGRSVTHQSNLYILLHKPFGVTATCKDEHAETTVLDLLPQQYRSVFPVGRLDKNSTGLLLLTNDGDLCYRLTHPRFEVEKEYLVKVRGVFKPQDYARARRGMIDDGEKLNVESIVLAKTEGRDTVLRVIVKEGKKRHLRRLFKQLSFLVLSLQRVRIGKLYLDDLGPGEYKVFDRNKIYALFKSVMSAP